MPGPSDPHNPAQQPSRAPRARVVLFRQPGTGVPADLRDALRRNHTDPIEVDHALAAMAQLCLAKTAVLLLCEPRNLAGVSELLASVERYIPRVTRWEYMPGENPPLRPVGLRAGGGRSVTTSSPTPKPEQKKPDPKSGRSVDSFALRLTDETGAHRPAKSVNTSDLLSRDEMEALFSEDSP